MMTRFVFQLLVIVVGIQQVVVVSSFTSVRITFDCSSTQGGRNSAPLKNNDDKVWISNNKMTTLFEMKNNNVDFSNMNSPKPTTSPSTASQQRSRRTMMQRSIVRGLSILTIGTVGVVWTRAALAASNGQRSRTQGYEVQKTEQEWKEQLSSMEYFVLREGGTERPGFSILEKEKRAGIYKCAGCSTSLFVSESKFSSGTGWPSFASALSGVEVEVTDPFTANLMGTELRCKTCGGHLGDVFNDGFLFVGTPAFQTGKRYCIDGAALIFYPTTTIGNSDNNTDTTMSTVNTNNVVPLRGDTPSKQSTKSELPSIFDAPKIVPRSREF